MSTSEVLTAALGYAARGWGVIPLYGIRGPGQCSCGNIECAAGKHPQVAHGLRDASTDPAIITEWFTRLPGANVGVLTGEPSGIVVLDIDPRNGGTESLAEIEREFGPLPATLEAATGGDGRHLVFRHPGQGFCWRKELARGIDIKADGGYIVAPPSKHASGKTYAWKSQADIAAVPPTLLARMVKNDRATPAVSSSSRTPIAFAPGGTTTAYGRAALKGECDRVASSPEGQRNNTLNEAALKVGQCVAGGELDEAEARVCLQQAGLAAGLPAIEVTKTINSGMSKGRTEPRTRPIRDDVSRAGTAVTTGHTRQAQTPEDGGGGGVEPVLISMADIQPRQVAWLWSNRIPLGRITLVSGMPGVAKSFMTMDMAARVSTGSPWPDGAGHAPKGEVIIMTAEDDPADTIRPRLDSAHADVARVHLLSAVRRFDEDGQFKVTLVTLQDIDAIEAAVKAHPDCKLIIIDPIGSFLGGRTDAHRDNEVRAVLAPLARIAERYGPAIVIVAHRRKAAGGFADDTVLGSRAFTGLARAVWHIIRDPQDRKRRLMLSGKNNLADDTLNGLAFTIEGEPARVCWERGPVQMTADEAVAAEGGGGSKPGPKPMATENAQNWLQELLARGPLRVGDEENPPPGSIRAQAKSAGLSWSTVRRAASAIRIRHIRPGGPGAPWKWQLSGAKTRDAQVRPEEGQLEQLEQVLVPAF